MGAKNRLCRSNAGRTIARTGVGSTGCSPGHWSKLGHRYEAASNVKDVTNIIETKQRVLNSARGANCAVVVTERSQRHD